MTPSLRGTELHTELCFVLIALASSMTAMGLRIATRSREARNPVLFTGMMLFGPTLACIESRWRILGHYFGFYFFVYGAMLFAVSLFTVESFYFGCTMVMFGFGVASIGSWISIPSSAIPILLIIYGSALTHFAGRNSGQIFPPAFNTIGMYGGQWFMRLAMAFALASLFRPLRSGAYPSLRDVAFSAIAIITFIGANRFLIVDRISPGE